MLFAYPATFKTHANGHVSAVFPDVPEALSPAGAKRSAMKRAQEHLTEALAGYVLLEKRLPVPSPVKRGQQLVLLPPTVAIKLAILDAKVAQNLTLAELSLRMGCDHRTLRRILNVHHKSTVPQLQAALDALGLRVGVVVTTAV